MSGIKVPDIRNPDTCVFCWTYLKNTNGAVMHKDCWKQVERLVELGKLDDEMSEGFDWDLYETGCEHCNTDECYMDHSSHRNCFRKIGPIEKGFYYECVYCFIT